MMLALVLPGVAAAELRQHVLADMGADPDQVISEFVEALREAGYTVAPGINYVQMVGVQRGTLSFKQTEYNAYHADGRSLYAVFFFPTEDRVENSRELLGYLSSAMGYSLNANLLQLPDLGYMGYYEWTPSSLTFKGVLEAWLDRYTATE